MARKKTTSKEKTKKEEVAKKKNNVSKIKEKIKKKKESEIDDESFLDDEEEEIVPKKSKKARGKSEKEEKKEDLKPKRGRKTKEKKENKPKSKSKSAKKEKLCDSLPKKSTKTKKNMKKKESSDEEEVIDEDDDEEDDDFTKKKKKRSTTVKTKTDKSKKSTKPKKEKTDKVKPEKKDGYYPMTSKTKLSDVNCENFLKGECSNKYCRDIHNFSVKNKEQNNQEFSRRYFTLAQDFMILEPYERKLYAKANLDLMFLMDCTGSMSSWIETAKKELNNIIDFIKENNPYSKIRVSFIGYRDHCDKNGGLFGFGGVPIVNENYSKGPNPGVNSGQYSYIDFDEDIDKVKWFISTVRAFGGGDLPEDVAGGLKIGLEQDWKSPAKYCVLVCDAPCHGTKYHDSFGDSYPLGDPNKLVIEDLVSEYAKRDINFFAVKITRETDKMFKIMSDTYKDIAKKPITISEMGSSTDKFGFFVAFGASNTLSSVTMNGFSLKDFLNQLRKDSVTQGDLGIISADDKDKVVDKDNGKMLTEKKGKEETFVGGVAVDNSFHSKLQEFVKRLNTLMGEEENDSNIHINEDMIKKADENAKNIEMSCSMTDINKIKDTNSLNNLPSDCNKIEKLEFKLPENPQPPKNWDKISDNILDVICHSYFISKDRNTEINWKNPFIGYSNIQSRVMLKEEPFAAGAMRYAFHMKDIDLDQKLVAKLPKTIVQKDYTQEKLAKELETITICQHIVSEFNERTVNIVPDTRLLLNFVNAWIYEITSDHPYKYYSVENFISGYYEKYNNNAGWINENLNESALLAQAFSHFSWQITKGFMMIVDLQGVGGVLTDPQIHCLNINKFGKGNLGYVGILKFFMSHMCNSYCKKLELVHPRNKKKIDKDYEFFVDKYVPPTIDVDIWKLCDLCREPFQKKAKELYELRKKCWEAFCSSCDQKRKASWVWSTCSECSGKFTNSAYWFKMKRHSFPDKCMKCRNENRTKEREEHNEKFKGKDTDDGMIMADSI